ncbi:MAG: archaetidylserine decarboxylase [Oleiphilaceae bacterium]|nr:archaetidylserine decarboxylase [Oleiphilaceae bacterium]
MNLDDLFVFSQYLTPQHLLSRGVGKLAECETKPLKEPFIRWFIKRYGVDMSEAAIEQPEAFRHFNDFFTRALKPDARTVDERPESFVSPVDGAISQLGEIKQGRIFQAKGQDFNVTELLGGDVDRAQPFIGGQFATIYLSPKDYHRIHMPITGTLREMVYVPGKLFSVNPVTTEKVPRLFARNERVVAIFDTEKGPLAMVLVGAMIVASIETVWSGLVAPIRRQVRSTQYGAEAKPIEIKKGEEMGRFKLGSTVVMLTPGDSLEFAENLQAGSNVRMGQHFATIKS